MRILEKEMAGKNPDPTFCEDAWILTDDFIAICDGATDKSGWRSPEGETGGRVAAWTLATGILALPKEITAREAINELTNLLDGIWTGYGLMGRFHKTYVILRLLQ
jgi:hypothetical protein